MPRYRGLDLCALLAFCALCAPRVAQPTLHLSAARIEIGAFYRGTVLQADGTVPLQCQVALELTGERETVDFNRKGRFGPLWLNRGGVFFEGLPHLYMVATSCGAADVEWEEALSAHGVGYAALRKGIGIRQSPPGEDSLIFDELLSLKERAGLFAFLPEKIDLIPRHSLSAGFSVRFQIPASAPPGAYRATLYCFSGGRLLAKTGEFLTVEKVGFTRLVTDLAFHNSALYGMVAVVAALLTGLSIGALFNRKK